MSSRYLKNEENQLTGIKIETTNALQADPGEFNIKIYEHVCVKTWILLCHITFMVHQGLYLSTTNENQIFI